jgi:hypothetical protein
MSFETSQNQEIPTFFRRGELVFLREGRENGPEKKQVVVAKLLSDIRVGTVLAIDNHVEVGVVESVQKSGDSIQVKTSAGLYEVGKVFRGLTIDSEIGTVSLPVDAKFAQLAPGSAKSLNIGGGAVHIEINRDALKGVLLETNGSVVHKLGSRYVVLARVGNAPIPFYRSSSGTDGKRQGDWYPFFGHTGSWIIKGAMSGDGDMHYHPSITRIQNLLNTNLILPDTKYLNRQFELRSKGDDQLIYKLDTEISIDDIRDAPYQTQAGEYEKAERDYVERVTGYAPKALEGYHTKDRDSQKALYERKWIEDIVSLVEDAT